MRATQEYLAYLKKCREAAYNQKFRYSKNYAMTLPSPGYEKEYGQAVEECALVDELISLVEIYGIVSKDISSTCMDIEDLQRLQNMIAKDPIPDKVIIDPVG